MSNQLPSGYAERQIGNAHVVARIEALPFVVSAVETAGSLYAWALEHSTSRLAGGRGDVAVVEGATGEPWAVRHLWRGGLAANVLGDRHLRIGAERPLAELKVNAILRSRGVNTPEVMAAVVLEQGMWYRGDVAARMIPAATDLAALSLGPERWTQVERERAWFAAGALLHQFFMTGAVHADLNLRNIIVQRDTMQAYLLDLDRCEVGERMRGSAVDGMLGRFHRSRHKLERLLGAHVSATELAALKRGRGV